MNNTKAKRPMSPEEIEAAKMLRGVSYPTGTFDKRMGAIIAGLLVEPPKPQCTCPKTSSLVGLGNYVHFPTCAVFAPPWAPMIPEKLVSQLWRLVGRYRRQIRHPQRVQYIRMAELLATPNAKKRAKGLKILARRAKDRAKHHARKAKAVGV